MHNSFGRILKITTYGESHGLGIGVVLDGFPAGIWIDEDFLASEMARRKPGQSRITTRRTEDDLPIIQSGVFNGKSTGTPIGLFIPNQDAKSKDYDHLKDTFRPGHADLTYAIKYGNDNRDYRGGGRSSARETAARVAAGAFAKMLLREKGISITAWVSAVGDISIGKINLQSIDSSIIESNPVRCPVPTIAEEMFAYIDQIRKQGDSVGGIVSCLISGVPAGLGQPIYGKIQADLASAMLSINATKGFEYGEGFASAKMKGSEHNDSILPSHSIDKPKFSSNHAGGLLGGITTGEPIFFNVAFKPVATIMQTQDSISADGEKTIVEGKGRHDPCVVPRAVPIVEAMAALVIADHLLLANKF